MSHSIFRPLLISALLMSSTMLTGCVIHVGGGQYQQDYDVDEDLDISGTHGDISSVNDDINLSSHSSAQNVDSVNGDIKIKDNVTLHEVNTVNGDINSGRNLTVTGTIESVNGDIEIESGATIGAINTVNGDIDLNDTNVSANVSSKNGDINLKGDTHISGDVIFEKRDNDGWNWGNNHNLPELEIGSQVIIDGHIILYRDVKLEIANPQLRKRIIYRDNR